MACSTALGERRRQPSARPAADDIGQGLRLDGEVAKAPGWRGAVQLSKHGRGDLASLLDVTDGVEAAVSVQSLQQDSVVVLGVAVAFHRAVALPSSQRDDLGSIVQACLLTFSTNPRSSASRTGQTAELNPLHASPSGRRYHPAASAEARLDSPRSQGGFQWSSQHLDDGGAFDGMAEGSDFAAHGTAGDAVAGAASAAA